MQTNVIFMNKGSHKYFLVLMKALKVRLGSSSESKCYISDQGLTSVLSSENGNLIDQI